MTEKPTDNLFNAMSKSELWYGLLPELLHIERKWITLNGINLEKHLPASQLPYLSNAIILWEQALNATMNGQGGFASHVLRSILERSAFLWATSNEIGQDPEKIISGYSSTDRKQRRRITDDLIDAAKTKDTEVGLLYDEILSRYYNHISHLDTLSVDPADKNAPKLSARLSALAPLHVFDVGVCLGRAIEHLLTECNIKILPFEAGRVEHRYDPVKYVRAAEYVMCEKHSRNKAIELRMLMTNMKEITGQVGITDVYRGGMVIIRYGEVSDKPTHEVISGLSIFAIGNKTDQSSVKAKLVDEQEETQQYELSWPKQWDITYALIALMARNPQEFPMFDYVTEFVGQL